MLDREESDHLLIKEEDSSHAKLLEAPGISEEIREIEQTLARKYSSTQNRGLVGVAAAQNDEAPRSSKDPHLFDVRPTNPNLELLNPADVGPDELNNYLPSTGQEPLSPRNDENDSIDSFDGVEFFVYLFANPRSGSQKAKWFLELGYQNCQIDLGQNMRAMVQIFNVIDPVECSRGLRRLAKKQKGDQNHNHHIRMIMAGGDGSLMTLVNKAKEAGCDIGNLVCCVLPFGTGNDLSRSLKWGGDESGKIYRSLPKLVREVCLNTTIRDLDIWTILIKFRQGGTTLEIDSKTRAYKARNETFFERYMINYFSMGEDARVGTGFEKNRTKYRFCNQCVYAFTGIWNIINCCGKPEQIYNQLEECRTLKMKTNSLQLSSQPLLHQSVEEQKDDQLLLNPLTDNSTNTDRGQIIFTNKDKDTEHMYLKGTPPLVLGINIPSYMGGRAKPWKQADGNMGLKNPYKKSAPTDYNSSKKISQLLDLQKEDPSDGKLDWLTFSNPFNYALFKRGQRLILMRNSTVTLPNSMIRTLMLLLRQEAHQQALLPACSTL